MNKQAEPESKRSKEKVTRRNVTGEHFEMETLRMSNFLNSETSKKYNEHAKMRRVDRTAMVVVQRRNTSGV